MGLREEGKVQAIADCRLFGSLGDTKRVGNFRLAAFKGRRSSSLSW